MPRVNVEEVRIRIDDCWDKNNGQYYSIEFGNRETRVPDVSKASYEDQCATFQELIRKNRSIKSSFDGLVLFAQKYADILMPIYPENLIKELEKRAQNYLDNLTVSLTSK